ncbi:MAG: Glu/Leu/Phe/Val dehydrogenase, partial [Myxococcota bacterium]|nr:Glu/Leu/Phe/Val dehydrogenase [Myxococcota bacterium]
MSVFADMTEMGHEQVVFCRNEQAGLRAIIAIHDTTLGPALGGCRLYEYASEEDAIRDVLRLSKGMTYKAAVAGLDLGGGKAVIIGEPSMKNESLFRAFGRHVDSLGGRYITAEDMNTTVEDMAWIHRETRWVTGLADFQGGAGDPSPVTAWGVYHGIRACLEVLYGNPSVQGRTVAIQGVGNVGGHLARYLAEGGAKLIFTDISERRLDRLCSEVEGTIIDMDDFYSAECDVLAPCAVGGIINAHTIPRVKAGIIAGGANNQLEDEERDSKLLEEAGIIYAPDYIINAGGLIHVYSELHQYPKERAMADAQGIFDTIKRVINTAKSDSSTTVTAANR